jgi:flagellin
VDYASETAKLTQGRILSSAALSVMTQANAQPEAVLQLLRG